MSAHLLSAKTKSARGRTKAVIESMRERTVHRCVSVHVSLGLCMCGPTLGESAVPANMEATEQR